jgi:hypothetical protein
MAGPLELFRPPDGGQQEHSEKEAQQQQQGIHGVSRLRTDAAQRARMGRHRTMAPGVAGRKKGASLTSQSRRRMRLAEKRGNKKPAFRRVFC